MSCNNIYLFIYFYIYLFIYTHSVMSGIKRKLSEKEKVRYEKEKVQYFSIKLVVWKLRVLIHYFLTGTPFVVVL